MPARCAVDRAEIWTFEKQRQVFLEMLLAYLPPPPVETLMKLFLGTLLAAASVPAMALATASASLTGLHYELVDLDPSDGVTPFVEFTGQSMARAKLGSYCHDCKTFGSFTVPASVTVSDGLAAVSQAGLFASGQSGSSNAGPADIQILNSRRFEFSALARYQGVPGQPLFVLSAHTGLRITGEYTLDAEVDPFRTPEPLLRDTENSAATVFFSSRFIDGPDPSRSINAQSDWLSAPDRVHKAGEISVLLRNDMSHQATLWGKWGVNVSASVPSVPEPSTYALMLAGLVMVSATVRRRIDRSAR
jgi:hypothetical protein